ncbi:MAG: sugar ABC transporter permease [bacterium]|nr:sugar ABC transporter permease [Candidatus Sumerlaeota bacterium]
MRRKEIFWFWVMAGPATAGFLFLTLGPMLYSFYLSFTKYDVVNPPVFVGLGNYEYLLTRDPSFWPSVKVTLIFALFSIPLSLVLSLATAMLLNTQVRFRGALRTIYFLPSLLPATASSIIWIFIFHPAYGLLNQMLEKVGITGPPWTQSSTWALPTIVIMSLWGFGGGMIIFLAGLQGIPRSLYEAASLDGATRWQQFRHVTLTQISPILFFNLVMGIIGSLKVFDQAFTFGTTAVARLGAPGRSTLFYVLNMYQKSFNYFHMGLGSAMAWMLFLAILILTVINFIAARKWVHTE